MLGGLVLHIMDTLKNVINEFHFLHKQAALAAYKKDLQNNREACPNPEEAWKVTNSFAEVIEPSKLPTKAPEKKNKKKEKKTVVVVAEKEESREAETKVWYEAVTDEGHKYYWNTLNSGRGLIKYFSDSRF